LFLEQNIEDLLLAQGIRYGRSENASNGSQDAAQTLFDTYLPLELFDDANFDPRTPQEWLGFRVRKNES
jgi:hypothetical protein